MTGKCWLRTFPRLTEAPCGSHRGCLGRLNRLNGSVHGHAPEVNVT